MNVPAKYVDPSPIQMMLKEHRGKKKKRKKKNRKKKIAFPTHFARFPTGR